MSKKLQPLFLGVSNEALAETITIGLFDADLIAKSGMALPPAKIVEAEERQDHPLGMLGMGNAVYGAYLEQSAEIRKTAQTIRAASGDKPSFEV